MTSLTFLVCLGSDSSCSGSGSKFSPGGANSESDESGSDLHVPQARRTAKPGTAKAGAVGKGRQQPDVRQSKPNRNATPSGALAKAGAVGKGKQQLEVRQSPGSKNRRKSIKESKFAEIHSELLKPVYKYYQAMHFATYGANFQWEATHRARCVRILLDAAKECHGDKEEFSVFEKAVEAELHGGEGMPR